MVLFVDTSKVGKRMRAPRKASVKTLVTKENDKHIRRVARKVLKGTKEIQIQTASLDSQALTDIQAFCTRYPATTTFIKKLEAIPNIPSAGSIVSGAEVHGIQTREGDSIKLKNISGTIRFYFTATGLGTDQVITNHLQVRHVVYVGKVSLGGYQLFAKENDDANANGFVTLVSPIKPIWKSHVVSDKILKLNAFVKGMAPIVKWRKKYKGLGKKLKFTAVDDPTPEDWHVQHFFIIEKLEGATPYVTPTLNVCIQDKYFFYDDE